MNDFEKEILQKAMRFCAYRERATSEVHKRLQEWEIPFETAKKIVKALQKENFVNDKRFATNFALGKFRNNAWGMAKIKHALYSKGIDKVFIEEAVDDLDENQYEATIRRLVQSKRKTTKAKNDFELRKKIAAYLMRKGFEAPIVWEVLKSEIQD